MAGGADEHRDGTILDKISNMTGVPSIMNQSREMEIMRLAIP